jgi:hypothetical protein
MKMVWARRPTTCKLCEETINSKIQRLDENIRIKGRFTRLHYHPECFVSYVANWHKDHPYEAMIGNSSGRPSLGLSAEEATTRRKLLANLGSLHRYYFPKNKPPLLNIQGDITTLTKMDIRRFENFKRRYSELSAQLEPIGGMPVSRGGLPEAQRRKQKEA